MQREYLNFAEAAEFLGITKSTLYKMTHKKLIPYYKPTGKYIYFSAEDLRQFVKRGKISAAWEVEESAEQYLHNRMG
jgi:excisionase family DNA binding protein